MAVSAALTVVLALATSAAPERVLLCRPKVVGDPRLARGEALAEAARTTARFLDYGVPCEDAAEGARAARRVGLAHAVSATAEGRGDASRYVLVLADAATEGERARRGLDVAPGADAVTPLRAALSELLGALPAPPGPPAPRFPHLGAWTTFGLGVASLAASYGFSVSARSAADRANGAADPATYTGAREEWRSRRSTSRILLVAGAAAVVGGLTWRYAF